MGWPLYRASREFVTLTIKDDDWSNIVIDQSGENSSVRQSLLEKYRTRPIDFLPETNLLDFAKYYKRGDSYHCRRRDAVVRVFPRIKLDLDSDKREQYFKLQCVLNIPFHGDFQNILERLDCQSWAEAYEKSGIQDLEHLEIPQPEDEGFLPERINEEQMQEQYMVAASFRGMAADVGVGHRLIDKSYNWNSMPSFIPSFDQVSEFMKTFKSSQARRLRETDQSSIIFSSDQLSVLSVLDTQIRSIQRRSIRCPKRMVVQGKAGSGKSTVIKEIVRRVSLALGEDSIRVCAPTGAAAINIDGNTIHSLLRLPIVSSKFKHLNGESAQKFQNELKSMKFIIIDEMSMIGARMLYMIEKRLREINPERDEAFGGIFIYLFGDFRQLPPVKDTPLYSSIFYDVMAQQGRFVFDSFQRFFELSNSHRQNSADSSFREVLEHLANGSFNEADHNTLITRNRAYLPPSELASFSSAVELYPTNEQVRESNERYLEANGKPVAFISSENAPDIALPSSKDEAALGLAKHLKLSMNARVMPRTNLWVAGGLVNGSLGTVRYIVYPTDRRPPALPLFILVEFDNYQGPYITQNLFPIVPITRSWNDGNVTRSRRQFPLSLAYSMTIHKSQGLTLPKIKVDIGKQETAIGLTYVAMSRVRNLNDIIFVKSYNKDRYDSICKSKAHKDRQTFLHRWHSTN
ncbi:ATP-dependent DNA helicase Pif1-like [Brevipalpus obovatus]|uniref:ATP-dependent DNA helicase Pif1-like n=1 Tax=Brevipalpus obovatus TaxID=246614 RepID=UPI003D9F7736